MATATKARKREVRVAPMKLWDVLMLYVEPHLRGAKCEGALNVLWGKWCACQRCNTIIALHADVLWDGENSAFVHAGHISCEDAVPWGDVFLPDHPKRLSVAGRLRLKRREQEKKAQEAA